MLAIFLFLPFLIFHLATSQTLAAESNVVLNEIFTPGSSDWVEIYNTSPNEIDISGWKILDNSTTPVEIFPTNTRIDSGKFLVLEVSNRLNNGGDSVRLINSGGIEVDKFEYTSSVENKSFARIPDGTGSWFGGRNPTKGATNGSNPPSSDSEVNTKTGKIILSEFMPNPDGGQEWVELYNPNNFDIDIGGWKIDDIEGASSPFKIPENTKINSKSFKLFSFSSKLNNSGDSVRLINKGGSVLETYTYDKTIKGLSFAKNTKGTWQLTSTPTPGGKNKITLVGYLTNSLKKAELGGYNDILSSNLTAATGAPLLAQDIGNYTTIINGDSEEKIAGISKAINENNKFSTLLVAAGFSFLFSSFTWPLLERRLWKKKH